jgi:hypothetical protein
MIDKVALLAKLRDDLERDVAVMEKAASTAHDAATHPEMKPENDKDTRGIEAGYLAGAQSLRALEMRRMLDKLRALKARPFNHDDAVDDTALVELADDKGARRFVFICPFGAGMKAKLDGVEVQVVTPESPLGEAVVGKRAGDVVEMNAGGRVRSLEIVAVR